MQRVLCGLFAYFTTTRNTFAFLDEARHRTTFAGQQVATKIGCFFFLFACFVLGLGGCEHNRYTMTTLERTNENGALTERFLGQRAWTDGRCGEFHRRRHFFLGPFGLDIVVVVGRRRRR